MDQKLLHSNLDFRACIVAPTKVEEYVPAAALTEYLFKDSALLARKKQHRFGDSTFAWELFLLSSGFYLVTDSLQNAVSQVGDRWRILHGFWHLVVKRQKSDCRESRDEVQVHIKKWNQIWNSWNLILSIFFGIISGFQFSAFSRTRNFVERSKTERSCRLIWSRSTKTTRFRFCSTNNLSKKTYTLISRVTKPTWNNFIDLIISVSFFEIQNYSRRAWI